jgi:hypothetical protein
MPDEQYHRVESSTQTQEDAVMQVETGEIWGKEPYGSQFLVVQAYRMALSEGKRGIQFTTEVRPQRGSGTPFEARWYYQHTPGVLLRQKGGRDYAAIPAKVQNFHHDPVCSRT